MLVKIKQGDQTIQYDSKDVLIAVLFTPADKEIVEKMEHADLLFLSGPFSVMAEGVTDAWHWAFNGWKGATFIDASAAASQAQPIVRKG